MLKLNLEGQMLGNGKPLWFLIIFLNHHWQNIKS